MPFPAISTTSWALVISVWCKIVNSINSLNSFDVGDFIDFFGALFVCGCIRDNFESKAMLVLDMRLMSFGFARLSIFDGN